jgi:hypothetical protein
MANPEIEGLFLSRMKRPLDYFARVLGVAAILFGAGCATASTHQTAFDESAFKHSHGSGNATVTGRAYAVYRGDQHLASEQSVQLLTVNAYTTEIVQGGLLAGHPMQSDPRLAKYTRLAASDSNGNFVIRHVAAGEYFVITFAEWSYQYESENADDTGTDTITAEFKKPIFARITVRSGQTVRVRQWNQNCPDIGPPFAHG